MMAGAETNSNPERACGRKHQSQRVNMLRLVCDPAALRIVSAALRLGVEIKERERFFSGGLRPPYGGGKVRRS
jgi:hypothetical protein